ncbi:MAG TPA: hypothetical protein VJ936_08690, partial [Desulfobacteraceae bacterium]|nr:hypothetical protein [Desulfobacteraceae bacterium]
MAKKKNKKAKQKKHVTMDCDQLEAEGNLLLVSKNTRKAIKFLKSALKKAGEPAQKERIRASLFASYLAREKELKKKNMQDEAEEVFQQAMEHLPDMANTTEETLVLLITSSSSYQAFDACSRFFDHHKPSQRITRLLGEKLVTENGWDLLDLFDNLTFLNSGADLIQQAAALMNKGKWEEAKDVMQTLPRSSPFFNLRMFCRAMVSFYADNDADMVKALSTIDEKSLFNESAAVLKASVNPGPGGGVPMEGIDSDNPFLPLFYKTGFNIQHQVTGLINHLKKRGYNTKCASLIQELARSIYPEDTEVAVFYLVETVWSRDEFFDHPDAEDNYFSMIEESLLKGKAEYLKTKIQILLSEDILSDTAIFLKLVEKEIFDPEERAIATSTAILKALTILHASPDDSCLDQVTSFEKKVLGITSGELWEALLETAYHGVTIDRYNRKLFEAAAALPCRSRNAQKIKEKIFVLMGEVFPKDPYPCLELATLYHGKNAYRKAENILEKAKEIAPHDQRVLDKHVISLLISADRNIARKKFHLAWNDLEKAEAFHSRNCDLLIKEKKFFSRIVEKPEIPIKALKIKLNSFPDFTRARLAAMLFVDITRAGKKQDLDKAKTKVSSLFNRRNFKELTSSEAAALLLPLPREWQAVVSPPGIAPVFLDIFDGFLDLLDDGDLFEVIDRIDTPQPWDKFMDQLDQ